MPASSNLAHRVVSDTNIPYISNQSPTVTEACYVAGSVDILTSINGYAERRPGFANSVEPTPTVFVNLQRQFTWDDFAGNFYVMFCDITATSSLVYKMQVGVDNSAVLIYTDTSSANPFDFVVSNNTCYFGNAHVMKKWNPQIGVENWGIAIGSVNDSFGPDNAGAGANDGSSGVAWTNPNNVTSSVSFATVGLIGTGVNSHSQNDDATTFGFSVPSTTTIVGVGVSFNAFFTQSSGTGTTVYVIAQLLKNGNLTGASKFVALTTTPTVFTLGSSSDLWSGTFTANDVNQATWGVAFQSVAIGGGTLASITTSLNTVQATIFGTGGPGILVSASAGTFSATVGYEYVFTYGNSLTGHVSSPTPVSASTGVFTSKLNVQVSLTASTDPQVNQIHVYRTTDSTPPGVVGGTFFELPNSPFPNTTANITDNAPDDALNIYSIAPTPTFNDPPPPSFGFTYGMGRIWMIDTNGKVWFTGLEEIVSGVPEESVPSGIAGNYWSFDEGPQGLGTAGTGSSQVIGVFCGGRIYGVSGNTLDTQQRYLISNRRGCRNRKTITMMGGMCAWLDTANQIWATDGSTLQELSIPIRPDLSGITQSACSMSFHTAGRFHWLAFSSGTRMLVYDIDTEQWMPPWSFAPQYLFSGETSPGNYQLLANTKTKALALSTTAFNDNGSPYQWIIKTNLMSVVPDFGRRFSYVAGGIYNEPSRTGCPWVYEIDTNDTKLFDVLFLADDDPTQGLYTSIHANKKDVAETFNRTQGKYIKQQVFPVSQPMARWVSLQVQGYKEDQVDNIYGWFIAYESKR